MRGPVFVPIKASTFQGSRFSQGPGVATGTASHFIQLAMAIIVWGASALLVGIGLIGAARRRMR